MIMRPDYDAGFVISLSAIPFVMNVLFLFGGWFLYKFSSKNRRINAIQILPDLLERDHKTVFYKKLELINKKVKSQFILVAVINTILLLVIIAYSFVLVPLIQENISQEGKFEIFSDLILFSIKYPSILYVLLYIKTEHSPIPKAWIELFRKEGIDFPLMKMSKNPLSRAFWTNRMSLSDSLFIYARSFIKEYYPNKLFYIYSISKNLKKFSIFIEKDKIKPYHGFNSFKQFISNRLVHVLLFSELKKINVKPPTKFHPYSIFGTCLIITGFVSIYGLGYYWIEFLLSLLTIIFLIIVIGVFFTIYGDFKLLYINHASLQNIMSSHNIADTDNISRKIIDLFDVDFPYVQL